MVLPEVIDSKAWWDGKLPFIDEEGHVAAVVVYVQSLVFINTQLVKPNELESYNEQGASSQCSDRVLELAAF